MLVAAVMVVASASVAWAQPKTDVVTLNNGDRLTGEIKDLDRGRLEFKTDDAGTIDIEWDNISSVVATRFFEIETSDGRRLLGNLGRAPQGMALVTSAAGDVSLMMFDVTRITPINSRFWSRFDGAIDFGFSYTRSSEITQVTFNSFTTFRRPAFVIQLTTSATVTHEEDEDDRNDRGTAALQYIRYRGKRLLLSGGGRFETNESLGLLLRSQAFGLVGARLVNSNRAQVEIGAGAGVNNEQGLDAEPTDNIEAILGFTASRYTYDGAKTMLDASVLYYPSLSNWGRQRLQVDGSARRELLRNFTVSVNVYDTFDSEPPNPDSARNDVGVVISAGWTF